MFPTTPKPTLDAILLGAMQHSISISTTVEIEMTDEWYDDFNIVHRWFHHILPPESENQTGKPIRIFQYMANKNQITVSVEYLIYSFTSCPAVLYSILVSNYNYFFFRLFFTN